jgi:hypothetical protein
MAKATKGGLGKWFGEKWVDISRKDASGKHPPCGRGEADTSSAGYPKCRPAKKAAAMTPAQKKSAVARKRAKPQGVGGKPTIVK